MICFPYMIHYVCKVASTMSFYKCNGTTNLRALLALYHKVGTINTYHLFNTNDMFHSPCLNHIFQHTLYARLIQSILPMQNIRPSGGNTFFPSPRFQLVLCHTFVLCNDTVAYAQMVGRDGGASLRFSRTSQLAMLLASLRKSSPAKLAPWFHCDFLPPSPP